MIFLPPVTNIRCFRDGAEDNAFFPLTRVFPPDPSSPFSRTVHLLYLFPLSSLEKAERTASLVRSVPGAFVWSSTSRFFSLPFPPADLSLPSSLPSPTSAFRMLAGNPLQTGPQPTSLRLRQRFLLRAPPTGSVEMITDSLAPQRPACRWPEWPCFGHTARPFVPPPEHPPQPHPPPFFQPPPTFIRNPQTEPRGVIPSQPQRPSPDFPSLCYFSTAFPFPPPSMNAKGYLGLLPVTQGRTPLKVRTRFPSPFPPPRLPCSSLLFRRTHCLAAAKSSPRVVRILFSPPPSGCP